MADEKEYKYEQPDVKKMQDDLEKQRLKRMASIRTDCTLPSDFCEPTQTVPHVPVVYVTTEAKDIDASFLSVVMAVEELKRAYIKTVSCCTTVLNALHSIKDVCIRDTSTAVSDIDILVEKALNEIGATE